MTKGSTWIWSQSLVLKPQDGCEKWLGRAGRWVEGVRKQTEIMKKQSLTKEEWKDVYWTLVMIPQLYLPLKLLNKGHITGKWPSQESNQFTFQVWGNGKKEN